MSDIWFREGLIHRKILSWHFNSTYWFITGDLLNKYIFLFSSSFCFLLGRAESFCHGLNGSSYFCSGDLGESILFYPLSLFSIENKTSQTTAPSARHCFEHLFSLSARKRKLIFRRHSTREDRERGVTAMLACKVR